LVLTCGKITVQCALLIVDSCSIIYNLGGMLGAWCLVFGFRVVDHDNAIAPASNFVHYNRHPTATTATGLESEAACVDVG
jgi:hypothetical protein